MTSNASNSATNVALAIAAGHRDEADRWHRRFRELEHELTEARAEISRHHTDFERVSTLAEAAHNALKAFEGDDPGMWVGDATAKVRDIRNIVG